MIGDRITGAQVADATGRKCSLCRRAFADGEAGMYAWPLLICEGCWKVQHPHAPRPAPGLTADTGMAPQ